MSHITLERRRAAVLATFPNPRRPLRDLLVMLANQRTLHQVFGRDVWWAELSFAVAAVAWSLIAFFSPVELTARAAWSPLGFYAPVLFWETSGAIGGVLQVAALLSGYRWFRWSCCFVMSWWWLFLGVTIALNDPTAPSWGLYLVAAGLNTVSLWKLWRPDEL